MMEYSLALVAILYFAGPIAAAKYREFLFIFHELFECVLFNLDFLLRTERESSFFGCGFWERVD